VTANHVALVLASREIRASMLILTWSSVPPKSLQDSATEIRLSRLAVDRMQLHESFGRGKKLPLFVEQQMVRKVVEATF